MKKLVLVLVWLTSIFGSIGMSNAVYGMRDPVYGTDSAQWLDILHITYQGKTYTDYKFDSTWKFSLDNSGCSNIIESFANGTDGRGTLKNPDAAKFYTTKLDPNSGDCQYTSSTVISLTNVADAKDVFVWDNSTKLHDVVQTSTTFVQDAQNQNLFRQTNGNLCKSTLEFGSDLSQAKLVVRSSGSTHYSDEPMPFKLEAAKSEGSNCNILVVQNNTPAHIGYVQNSSKINSDGTSLHGGSTAGGDTAAKDDPCVGASGSYSWILCPAVQAADDFLAGAYKGYVEPLLQIDALTFACELPSIL